MFQQIVPEKIKIEASSVCQLRCPSCPTTRGAILPAVGSGWLKFSDFKKLVDESSFLKEIEISNYGEIFLNPELLKILEYADRCGIALTANNGANLNHVQEEVLEGLVKYRLRRLVCSMDGASPETYSVYRVKGNFDKVIQNIKRINSYKEKYDSDFPQLRWQFVVFGHNEHEIPIARKLAQDLNMEFGLKLTWDDDFSPIRDKEFVRKEMGMDVASREEYKKKYGVDYMQGICHQLWDEPQINWDGKVLGCCRNFWGDFGGNAFKEGLIKSVNHEKMNYARSMLLGEKDAREDIPCTTCEIYLGMKAESKWLKREEMRSCE